MKKKYTNYKRQGVMDYEPITQLHPQIERFYKKWGTDYLKSPHTQEKKDNSDSPNTNYLGTRNTTREENKLGRMLDCADTHLADNL